MLAGCGCHAAGRLLLRLRKGLTTLASLWLDRGIEGTAKEAPEMLTIVLPVMMFVKCTIRKHRKIVK